ncbi:hypothetical protein D1007_41627 [Hordeum vulgare]|nr:hypothetical protein D1007_41627 [Hordeum vulgare]
MGRRQHVNGQLYPNPVEDGNMEEGPDDLSNEFGRAKTWSWGLEAVIRLATRLPAETLAQVRRHLAKWSLPSISELPMAGENVEVPVPVSSSGENLAMLPSIAAMTSSDATTDCHEFPEEEGKATNATGDGGGSFCFPRFDTMQSPLDHHYLEAMNPQDGGNEKAWVKTVQKEWKILMNGLPGLVLNNQPYYNEAGYEDLVGTQEGRRNALPYNERAYLLAPYGQCSTCYAAAAHRMDSRSSSRTTSVAGEDSCLRHVRHTFKDASSERS